MATGCGDGVVISNNVFLKLAKGLQDNKAAQIKVGFAVPRASLGCTVHLLVQQKPAKRGQRLGEVLVRGTATVAACRPQGKGAWLLSLEGLTVLAHPAVLNKAPDTSRLVVFSASDLQASVANCFMDQVALLRAAESRASQPSPSCSQCCSEGGCEDRC